MEVLLLFGEGGLPFFDRGGILGLNFKALGLLFLVHIEKDFEIIIIEIEI